MYVRETRGCAVQVTGLNALFTTTFGMHEYHRPDLDTVKCLVDAMGPQSVNSTYGRMSFLTVALTTSTNTLAMWLLEQPELDVHARSEVRVVPASPSDVAMFTVAWLHEQEGYNALHAFELSNMDPKHAKAVIWELISRGVCFSAVCNTPPLVRPLCYGFLTLSRIVSPCRFPSKTSSRPHRTTWTEWSSSER